MHFRLRIIIVRVAATLIHGPQHAYGLTGQSQQRKERACRSENVLIVEQLKKPR